MSQFAISSQQILLFMDKFFKFFFLKKPTPGNYFHGLQFPFLVFNNEFLLCKHFSNLISNHYFIKIEADTNTELKTGYYDLMYQGDELQFLVQRRKEIVDSNEISSIREELVEKDRYFIKKNDIYYRFRKKNSLLKILKDRKNPAAPGRSGRRWS